MPIVARPTEVGHSERTSYPFNASAEDFARELRLLPTRDLLAPIEEARQQRDIADLIAEYEGDCWNVVFSADDLGDGFVVACMIADRTSAMIREAAARRRSLDRFLSTHPGHPHTPAWPRLESRHHDRVDAIKAALSLETFCREHLAVDLRKQGSHLVGRCPFPGHDDRTPSFTIYPDGRSWCHGCNRGGDLIATAMVALNTTDFGYTLRHLEALAGLGGTR